MKIGFLFFLVVLTCLCCCRVNRFDAELRRHGRWVTYADSTKQQVLFKGRFAHGVAAGRACYYDSEGRLLKKEYNGRKKLCIRAYYPNGGLRMKGQARIELNDTLIRYYYYGRWKYFNEAGKLHKYGYFEDGRLLRSEYPNRQGGNDSLIAQLNRLEIEFNQRHRNLLIQINRARYNARETEVLLEKLYKTDRVTFSFIEELLQSGYPHKAELREAIAIPFYFLNYVPSQVKNKYLSLLEVAVSRGDLEAVSVARFVDKTRVGSGQPQLYGTQYFRDHRNELLPYTIEEPDDLEKRRKEMGLDTEPAR